MLLVHDVVTCVARCHLIIFSVISIGFLEEGFEVVHIVEPAPDLDISTQDIISCMSP